MGRRKNMRSSKKKRRRAAGLEAQRHLAGILESPQEHHSDVVDAAAVHLIKTSQRHRLSIPRSVHDKVCRKCCLMARSDEERGGWCDYCDSDQVADVKIPYAFKLMLQELMAMNIAPRMRIRGGAEPRPSVDKHRPLV